MKTLLSICALSISLIFVGCSTPQQAAYRATGSVVVTVDAAMNGWGDYVRAGLSTPAEENTVRSAYEKYQATMRQVQRLTDAYVSGQTSDKTTLDTAFSAVDGAKNDLITLIQSFRQSKPKPTP